jgi:hypothetical protein
VSEPDGQAQLLWEQRVAVGSMRTSEILAAMVKKIFNNLQNGPGAPKNDELPAQIAQEVGDLLSNLGALGWSISFARYDSQAFGNWYVDLERVGENIRLIKDRSQYVFEGPSYQERQAAHLEGSFNSFEEFQSAVSSWAEPRADIP